MENFKSILLLIIILAIVSLAGFWAVSSIESGSAHLSNQQQKELENTNKELEKEVLSLKKQIETLSTQKGVTLTTTEEVTSNLPILEPKTAQPTVEKPFVKTTVLKYQSLITELQKIVNSKTILKKGSQGISVGSIQKFLNIYNKTSTKVDNDYGISMVTSITKYQKDQGITVSGEAGVTTISKMIDWLKKQ